MLEPPDLALDSITACLEAAYHFHTPQVTFLPLGADFNTAVYRVALPDGRLYFLKLRRGAFDGTPVRLVKWLSERGITAVIPALETVWGDLWTQVGVFTVVVYPFVMGKNGYQVRIEASHWTALGTALNRVHTVDLPATLHQAIPTETYTPCWRQSLSQILDQIGERGYKNPLAAQLGDFMLQEQTLIRDLVYRAERCAHALQVQAQDFVLCHSDIHAGNVLLEPGGSVYLVDWDEPVLALKERDLMYVGGGQGFIGHSVQEETVLFYQGYGPAEINATALAYYRYERIVQDLVLFCQQLFSADGSLEDRQQSWQYLQSNFLPGNTIEIAYAADQTGF